MNFWDWGSGIYLSYGFVASCHHCFFSLQTFCKSAFWTCNIFFQMVNNFLSGGHINLLLADWTNIFIVKSKNNCQHGSTSYIKNSIRNKCLVIKNTLWEDSPYYFGGYIPGKYYIEYYKEPI